MSAHVWLVEVKTPSGWVPLVYSVSRRRSGARAYARGLDNARWKRVRKYTRSGR